MKVSPREIGNPWRTMKGTIQSTYLSNKLLLLRLRPLGRRIIPMTALVLGNRLVILQMRALCKDGPGSELVSVFERLAADRTFAPLQVLGVRRRRDADCLLGGEGTMLIVV
jgi:hypothetical protein